MKRLVAPALCVFGFVIFARLTCFSIVWVRGPSMFPTLGNESLVLVMKKPLMRALGRRFDRGDVVLCRTRGKSLVKRIAALQGDSLHIEDFKLVLRGAAPVSQSEEWENAAGPEAFLAARYAGKEFRVAVDRRRFECRNSENFVVPAGGFFLMGDNRCVALDSRRLGSVDEDALAGKAVWGLTIGDGAPRFAQLR